MTNDPYSEGSMQTIRQKSHFESLMKFSRNTNMTLSRSYSRLRDPVDDYLLQKHVDLGNELLSRGIPYDKMLRDPSVRRTFMELDKIMEREMPKKTYEKYLSEAIGRPITVEEYEAEKLRQRIGRCPRNRLLRLCNPEIDAKLLTHGSVSLSPFRFGKIKAMRQYFTKVFSSDKYKYLEAEE